MERTITLEAFKSQYKVWNDKTKSHANEIYSKIKPILDCMCKNDGIIPDVMVRKYELQHIISFYENEEQKLMPSDKGALRELYVERYGFCMITDLFVASLADFIADRRVLSVMSGPGVLEYHLKNAGVDIIATDNLSWCADGYPLWKETNLPMPEKLDAIEAIKTYGKEVDYVLLSWPPYKDSIAEKILLEMREVDPNLEMIYIGETQCGNCATDEFFELAECVDEPLFYTVSLQHRSFAGMHDVAMLLK